MLLRRLLRTALPAAAALALVPAQVAAAPAAPPPTGWHTEAIPSPAFAPLGLSFDAVGRAMLTWQACCSGPAPATPGGLPPGPYIGTDAREPAGGWRRVSNPPIQSSDSRLYLYGNGRAQQLGSAAFGPPAPGFHVLAADGTAAGGFGPPRTLDDNGDLSVSAADGAGDAIIAWLHARGRGGLHMRVAERSAGGAFSMPTFPAAGVPVAVGIDARGERIVAWRAGGAIYARVRTPGRPWGRPQLAARLPARAGEPVVSVAFGRTGTVALAWETTFSGCETCGTQQVSAGVAVHTHSPWRSFTLERSNLAPHVGAFEQADIVALTDTAGRLYATWNGVARGAPAVKFARVTPAGAGPSQTLSASVRAAALDDAVAGPRAAVLVTWSEGEQPGVGSVNASLRRAGRAFAPPVRLTPPPVHVPPGLAGFQPVTGEPVVVSGAAGGLEATVGPPG